MTAPAVPSIAELTAPAAWRAVDLISDLHLDAAEPATFDAWRAYMAAPGADAVLILGDLFEVWVGDDAATPGSFEAACGDVLRAASARRPVYFMAGNRDFLVRGGFLDACGVQPLADPTLLALGARRWLLTHGDALCLADVEYQRFRAQMRHPQAEAAMLARPLAERQAVARKMRAASIEKQRAELTYAEVDTPAASAWMDAARADALIHGHTHRPADHAMPADANDAAGAPRRRHVLSDWHLSAQPPRADVLRLHADGRIERLTPAAAAAAVRAP